MIKLDERLRLLASLVTVGARVADIGTDHGKLPIYLIEQGIASHVIACDIAEKPLNTAKENIALHYIEENEIETRLGGGLSCVDANEVDEVAIAGMGGDEIVRILSNTTEISHSAFRFLLQPMSAISRLRQWLCLNGFSIECEAACFERGKPYMVMSVSYTGEIFVPTLIYTHIGRLLDDHSLASSAIINREHTHIENLIAGMQAKQEPAELIARYKQLAEQLTQIVEKRWNNAYNK